MMSAVPVHLVFLRKNLVRAPKCGTQKRSSLSLITTFLPQTPEQTEMLTFSGISNCAALAKLSTRLRLAACCSKTHIGCFTVGYSVLPVILSSNKQNDVVSADRPRSCWCNRDMVAKYGIKYFYDITDRADFRANPDYKGVCHIAMAQEGHCLPGKLCASAATFCLQLSWQLCSYQAAWQHHCCLLHVSCASGPHHCHIACICLHWCMQ